MWVIHANAKCVHPIHTYTPSCVHILLPLPTVHKGHDMLLCPALSPASPSHVHRGSFLSPCSIPAALLHSPAPPLPQEVVPHHPGFLPEPPTPLPIQGLGLVFEYSNTVYPECGLIYLAKCNGCNSSCRILPHSWQQLLQLLSCPGHLTSHLGHDLQKTNQAEQSKANRMEQGKKPRNKPTCHINGSCRQQ